MKYLWLLLSIKYPSMTWIPTPMIVPRPSNNSIAIVKKMALKVLSLFAAIPVVVLMPGAPLTWKALVLGSIILWLIWDWLILD